MTWRWARTCSALTPYFGSDWRVRIIVGPPTSIDGSVLEGFVYLEGRSPTCIFDRSEGPDVFSWSLLLGPVLRIEELRPGRTPRVAYAHPDWTPRSRPLVPPIVKPDVSMCDRLQSAPFVHRSRIVCFDRRDPPGALRSATVDVVKTISQRQLRNDNAEVMRGVEEGETYTITRRGVPVARLVALAEVSDLRCDRPAKRHPSYTSLARVRSRTSTEELLNDLRGDR